MSFSSSSQQQQQQSQHHQSHQIPPASPFTPKWYYTNEELLRIPSIKDGIAPEQELKLRQQAVAFIQDLGNRLNSYVKDNRNRITNCVCVATIHLHRFFVFHSMQMFHPKDVAAACYFLAGKSEDCSRKLDAVVKNWLCLKNHLDKPPEMDAKRYEEAGDYIVLLESIILQTIGFNLQVELPHPIILKAMSDIFKESAAGTRSRSIMEIAYFFATDILFLTNWSVRYPMNTIACMCIYLTCQWAEFEIPNYPNCPWYSRIDPRLTEHLISELSKEFSITYSKADKIHVLAAKRLQEINRRDRPTSSSTIPSTTTTNQPASTSSGGAPSLPLTMSSTSTTNFDPNRSSSHHFQQQQQQQQQQRSATLPYHKQQNPPHQQQQHHHYQQQQQQNHSSSNNRISSNAQQQLLLPPPEPPSLDQIGSSSSSSIKSEPSNQFGIRRAAGGGDFDHPPPKIPAIEKKQKKLGLREYRERVALAAAASSTLTTSSGSTAGAANPITSTAANTTSNTATTTTSSIKTSTKIQPVAAANGVPPSHHHHKNSSSNSSSRKHKRDDLEDGEII